MQESKLVCRERTTTSWHSRIKSDASKNLTVKKVVQNNMENDLVLLFSGETLKQTKKKDLVREEKLKKLIDEYNVLNLDLFLNRIINLLDDKVKDNYSFIKK
ncbi:unnamed protein product [Brachionus calyciflorus]|uniref:Uncharacterized protein n=1 Tax=Brachionus calyciflorus TaxID=104777 RepID=A0A814LIK2_9BILA|nr:unnamed protein product [Brachionus calyciflorus]